MPTATATTTTPVAVALGIVARRDSLFDWTRKPLWEVVLSRDILALQYQLLNVQSSLDLRAVTGVVRTFLDFIDSED